MTGPNTIDVTIDPAFEMVTKLMHVTRQIMRPDSDYPPIGGGTTKVHLVTGEGPAWDPLLGRVGDEDETQCTDPFVWVRQVTRYRSRAFPSADVIEGCGGIPVIVMEVGIGRCVSIEAEVDWEVIAQEAEWGLDDAFRLEAIACALKGELADRAMIANEPAVPEGPEGGGIVWSNVIFIGIVS